MPQPHDVSHPNWDLAPYSEEEDNERSNTGSETLEATQLETVLCWVEVLLREAPPYSGNWRDELAHWLSILRSKLLEVYRSGLDFGALTASLGAQAALGEACQTLAEECRYLIFDVSRLTRTLEVATEEDRFRQLAEVGEQVASDLRTYLERSEALTRAGTWAEELDG